jgi:hypothetical protein
MPMERTLTLEFACCECRSPVGATVRCRGTGSGRDWIHQVAAVSIPCPDCGQINQVAFEPTGQVRAVRPFAGFRPVPEPSIN